VGAAGHSADVQLLSPYASYGYAQCANICSVNRRDNGRKQELLIVSCMSLLAPFTSSVDGEHKIHQAVMLLICHHHCTNP
jgi:hypothetical protein